MNKQKYSGLLAVVMIAAVAAFNVSLNSQEEKLSDLAMENVEALADESGGSGYKYVEPGSPGSGVACVCWQSGNKSCC